MLEDLFGNIEMGKRLKQELFPTVRNLGKDASSCYDSRKHRF